MARRRVFPSPETRAAQKLYESLIATGVGIAFIGMVTTCYLALSEAVSYTHLTLPTKVEV